MRILTWNVNSIRQRIDQLGRLAQSHGPDVICLQETKVLDDLFPAREAADFGYPHQVLHGQKARNGVAILSKLPFEAEVREIFCEIDDRRHVAVRVGGLELHDFYVPSGGAEPDPEINDKFRHKLQFLEEMAEWGAKPAVRKARTVVVGDLNVAPFENDVWNHKRLKRNVGHTEGECRRLLAALEAGGFVDVPRKFVPEPDFLFTWWGYRFPQSFEKNYGWRLDHAWVSAPLEKDVRGFEIVTETRTWDKPSDHVPVLVDLG